MKISFLSFNPYINNGKTASTQSPIAFTRKGIKGPERIERAAAKRLAAEEKFREQSEFHPATAFMYDPDMPLSDKHELIRKSESIKNIYSLAEALHVGHATLNVWIKPV